MKKPTPSQEFLSEKRARKAQRRWTHQERGRHQGTSRHAPARWTGWTHENHTYLRQLALCSQTKSPAPTVNVRIPSTFSIIDAPEDALRTIGLVAAAGGRADVLEVHYDHSGVRRYDLAAEAILDMVAMDVQ